MIRLLAVVLAFLPAALMYLEAPAPKPSPTIRYCMGRAPMPSVAWPCAWIPHEVAV